MTRLLLPALLVLLVLPCRAGAQTADELFDDGTLHEVRLSVHSQDWAKLKADFEDNTYYPADIEWRGVRVRNVGIRSRGLGTRNEFKPGLRVDMNRYTTGQQFLGLRSLILDNVYRDVSLIRDRVSLKLFSRMGFPAPRQSHARVYVNGDYVGVYAVTEELGEDFVRRAFRNEESGEPGRGVLFEDHWIDTWDFRNLGSAFEPYIPRFEPRTHENDPAPDLYGPIVEMVRTVNEAQIDRLTEDLDPYVDVRQFVRYVAVEAFLVEYDGIVGFKGMANFYLYHPESSTRAIFVPWDKDRTFYVANRDVAHALGENVLMRRAMEIAELRRLFYDTLAESVRVATERENDGATWLEREISRAAGQIESSVLADPNRWFGVEDFSDEIDRMLEFARTRPDFVKCQVDQVLAPDTARRECTAPNRVAPQ
jgi:spore coat protein CotH